MVLNAIQCLSLMLFDVVCCIFEHEEMKCSLLVRCLDTMTLLSVTVTRLLTSLSGRLTLQCVSNARCIMALRLEFVRSAASDLLRFAPTVRNTL